MAINFRSVALGIAALGLAIGLAFGAGVAYGRGDPKTVESGLTAQQIQSLLGISTAQATGAQGNGTQATGQGATGAGAQRATGGAQAAPSVTGRVTAIDAGSITVETRTGSQKVTLAPGATVSKITTGSTADIKEGQTVFVTGTRKDDGSIEASALSQVPAELQALIGGAAPAASATPTGGR